MASLHRRKNSQFWYVSFRIPEGVDPETGKVLKARQVLRCTKKKNRSDALRAAVAIEEAELIAANAGDDLSKRLLAVLSKATDFAAKGLLSETLTRQFLEEIYSISNEGSLETYSFQQWGQEWLDGKRRTVKPATYRLYDLATRKFAEFLGEKANARIEHVSTKDVETFRNELHDEGRTAKTANQYLKSLAGCFRASVDRGILLKNPCDPISPLPLTDSVRRKPFTIDEVKKLLSVADHDWRIAIEIGFFTGLRLRDVTELRWDRVDLEEGSFHVEPRKQARKLAHKKVLRIPMHSAIQDQLKQRKKSAGDEKLVFPALATKKTGGRFGLSFYFNRLMDDAGIDPEFARTRQKGQKGRAVPLKGFHSLRHTFISLLANQEIDRDLRKLLTGHTDDDSHDIYLHFESNRIRDAINSIPQLEE